MEREQRPASNTPPPKLPLCKGWQNGYCFFEGHHACKYRHGFDRHVLNPDDILSSGNREASSSLLIRSLPVEVLTHTLSFVGLDLRHRHVSRYFNGLLDGPIAESQIDAFLSVLLGAEEDDDEEEEEEDNNSDYDGKGGKFNNKDNGNNKNEHTSKKKEPRVTFSIDVWQKLRMSRYLRITQRESYFLYAWLMKTDQLNVFPFFSLMNAGVLRSALRLSAANAVAPTGAQLRTLVLDGADARSLKDTGAALAEHCPNLTSLSLCEMEGLLDKNLDAIIRSLGPRLITLKIRKNDKLTGAGLAVVAKRCQSLRTLDATECPETRGSFQHWGPQFCSSSIEDLSIDGPTAACFTALEHIAPSLKKLKLREIQFTPPATATSNEKLLSVSGALAKRCTQLKQLSITHCGNYQENFPSLFDELHHSFVSQLPVIQSLVCTHCHGNKPEKYSGVLSNCTTLTSLTVSDCGWDWNGLSDDDFFPDHLNGDDRSSERLQKLAGAFRVPEKVFDRVHCEISFVMTPDYWWESAYAPAILSMAEAGGADKETLQKSRGWVKREVQSHFGQECITELEMFHVAQRVQTAARKRTERNGDQKKDSDATSPSSSSRKSVKPVFMSIGRK